LDIASTVVEEDKEFVMEQWVEPVSEALDIINNAIPSKCVGHTRCRLRNKSFQIQLQLMHALFLYHSMLYKEQTNNKSGRDPVQIYTTNKKLNCLHADVVMQKTQQHSQTTRTKTTKTRSTTLPTGQQPPKS